MTTLRIGIAGIRGRMGREIAGLATNDPRITLVGGLSRQAGTAELRPEGVQLFADVAALLPTIDVLIDFTSPEATVDHATACAAAGVPMVCGTTGLDVTQQAALHAAAERTAIFHAANMSPALNAALAVLPALVQALQGYDIEIVETHHRHKLDAPSGTALALARVAAEASGGDLGGRVRYGREGARRRVAGEIGIHAVRSGGHPGEHEVILASEGEELRLSHRAFSRVSYAEGALRAACLIADQPPGWYDPATLPGFL
ncbi:MAG TPA: 4-hydroxy-tetrahydrodipicolinate reductase [Thermomicrobiales bacterium]|nr:4-hydroxy-tetrahydrodipicolinate reductase [Thermomicrobiales bacterium]